MWKSQETIMGQKVNVKFYRPSVCEGSWKIAKPHKFGFSISKQESAEIFKMSLFITGPVVHLRVVQLAVHCGSQ